MTLAVLLTFALAPQLQVVPFPSEAGQPVEVRVRQKSEPVAGVTVEMEGPGGATTVLGTTDAAGNLKFVPPVPGDYVIATRLDGVRIVLPHLVAATPARWPMALGCIPLGLAALVRLRRERGRRGS